ncbi:PepSY domain-containing protein [Streptomyces sp. VRA16 Mangrove soil]|uniref:PepSY domain-containing protein n=1 Tax=Streptomyces sp. VRA16 Mangrove soil TaxID=2817434 RepID=UPI001A9CCFD2|nr:PepSY domain-containing protein [Streptomyces sp. VRA16 Mangrove soil]MBO1336247.1 PepSY domain-containing protein [Streptomyces sp. VRA16 Mangrove soil]
MKRRTTLISAIAAVALIGGGAATAVAVSGDDDSSAASKSSVSVKDDGVGDAQENAAEAKGATIGAEEAIAAALKHTPGVVTGADLDSDDGRLVWDVDVIGSGATAWHHVEVDPGTGKVLGSHVDRDEDDDPARVAAALKGASTSASDAARAVSAKGTVTSVDADDDGSVTVWEVETTSSNGTQQDWNVDLRSGAVTLDRPSTTPDDD